MSLKPMKSRQRYFELSLLANSYSHFAPHIAIWQKKIVFETKIYGRMFFRIYSIMSPTLGPQWNEYFCGVVSKRIFHMYSMNYSNVMQRWSVWASLRTSQCKWNHIFSWILVGFGLLHYQRGVVALVAECF